MCNKDVFFLIFQKHVDELDRYLPQVIWVDDYFLNKKEITEETYCVLSQRQFQHHSNANLNEKRGHLFIFPDHLGSVEPTGATTPADLRGITGATKATGADGSFSIDHLSSASLGLSPLLVSSGSTVAVCALVSAGGH